MTDPTTCPHCGQPVPAQQAPAGAVLPTTTRPRRPLSLRQAEVLGYVHSYRKAHGYSPTLREIGRHLGIASSNAVNDLLVACERKGYLQRTPGRSRTLLPVD